MRGGLSRSSARPTPPGARGRASRKLLAGLLRDLAEVPEEAAGRDLGESAPGAQGPRGAPVDARRRGDVPDARRSAWRPRTLSSWKAETAAGGRNHRGRTPPGMRPPPRPSAGSSAPSSPARRPRRKSSTRNPGGRAGEPPRRSFREPGRDAPGRPVRIGPPVAEDVRRRDDPRRALLRRRAAERRRFVPRGRAVVDTREAVEVDLDHAARDCRPGRGSRRTIP